MKYKKSRKFLNYSFRNHTPTAKCDTSAFKVLHKDLRKQYEWYGNTLTYTGFDVHKDFLTEPNPQGQVLALPGDPFPVIDSKPFYLQMVTAITLNNTDNTILYTTGDAATVVNPNISVSQEDAITSLDTGNMQVAVATNMSLLDNLTIGNVGDITVVGTAPTQYALYLGTNIGLIQGGLNGTILYVFFNPGATNASVSALLQAVQFSTLDSNVYTKSVKFIVANNSQVNSDPGYTNIIVS